MADVARLAGVSHQTVSRVLNDHPRVAPTTRRRVLAAIEELGYRRNNAARALVTRRSERLGVVSFDTTLYGPASTLFSVEQAARSAGYFVSIVSLKQIDASSIDEAIGHLLDQAVDGIMVIVPRRESAEALARVRTPVPIVAVEGAPQDFPCVAVDQFAGAAMATEHLLDLGHETVWHVSGPKGWLEAEAREAGWRDALARAGRTAPPTLAGDWSPQSGYDAGRMLARTRDLKAVFVANDQMTLGLLHAFREHGLRVPEDVALVGYDDIPEAAFFAPPLTTVRQDFGAVGEAGIEMLLAMLDAEPPSEPPRVVIPPALVVRASSGA
jgi:DNA-binding LacI/PurR family transcriptional regulator